MQNPEMLWSYRKTNKDQAGQLARDLNISEITASLLIMRGISDTAAARKFLSPSFQDLGDPFLFTGMHRAVDRIMAALGKGEKILIYGDYDADGITAVSLLYSCLQEMGGQVSFYIPSRFDAGYGLHSEGILKAAEQGTGLIITVDCGENAQAEILEARAKGMDVIVTDHHQPQGDITALAHINPLREDAAFPTRNLAGVGVAFKLAQALLEASGKPKEACQGFLDLVALGTVADIVPLLGENRVLVKYGLQIVNEMRRPGLKALVEAAGLVHKTIEAGHIAFILAPRLNAAGRMGEAWPGVKLLTTQDEATAAQIAEELNVINKKRQQVEQEIYEAARQCVEAENHADGKVLVLAGEGWHEGVLGIVASRLSDAHGKPSILLSLDGAGQAKGSGRSLPGFNLVKALQDAADLLERFGGHELAAGLTLKEENVPVLREKLNALADRTMGEDVFAGRVTLDARVKEEELNLALAEELILLSPFGFGNPQPLLGGSFRVVQKRRVGKNGSHLKLKVENHQKDKYDALYFGNGKQGEGPLLFRQVEMAFFPEASVWRGQRQLALLVKKLALGDMHEENKVAVVDHRNQTKKVYLQELFEYARGNIMVYVNTRQEEELLSRLAKGRDITVLHQGKGPLPPVGEVEEHLVLWSLPMQEDKLLPFLAGSRGAAHLYVHALYGEEDYRQNQALLKASLPGQEILRELFTALVESRTAPLNISRLKQQVEQKLAFPVTHFSIQRALDIMGESGLLSLGEEAVTLHQEVFGEEVLKESSLFQEDSLVLENCRNFQEYLLCTDKEELWRFFARGSGEG